MTPSWLRGQGSAEGYWQIVERGQALEASLSPVLCRCLCPHRNSMSRCYFPPNRAVQPASDRPGKGRPGAAHPDAGRPCRSVRPLVRGGAGHPCHPRYLPVPPPCLCRTCLAWPAWSLTMGSREGALPLAWPLCFGISQSRLFIGPALPDQGRSRRLSLPTSLGALESGEASRHFPS